MKKLPSTILTGAAFALLLAGCQPDDQDPRVSGTEAPAMGEDRTSQAPARDPSLPAPEDYVRPDGTGTGSAYPDERIPPGGQDSSAQQDQNSPDTVTRDEERLDMPLRGQDGDRSTPPDQTSSR